MLAYDTPALRARFDCKVDRTSPSGCWLWTAKVGTDGYGHFYCDNKLRRAHRVAWELAHLRAVPEGLFVLHNCPGGDNPRCVNPDHLWAGTHAANMADADSKGRTARGDRHHSQLHPEMLVRGEIHHFAKVTAADVRIMRRLGAVGVPCSKIAACFGLSKASVWDIISRRTWAHVA